MSEHSIQAKIWADTNGRRDCRVFRNNVGVGYVGEVLDKSTGIIALANWRRIEFGLHEGSSDLIGWHTRTITEADIGKRIAQFVSMEVKSPTGRASAEQRTWLEQVKAFGGIAGVCRSVEDARGLIS